jgi:uncharacterized repeat protein (TIGR01451 family)
MRKLYLWAGLAVVGLGLAGWATLTNAQPVIPPVPDDPLPLIPVPPPAKGEAVSKPLPPPGKPEAELIHEPETSAPGGPDLLPTLPSAAATPASKQLPLSLPAPDAIKKPADPGLNLPPIPQLPDSSPKTEHAVEKRVEVDVPATVTAQVAPLSGARSHKQEPAVALEWAGPPMAKVGQPAEYALLVRNTCSIPVQKVTVQVRLPQGMNLQSSEPKADTSGGVLLWDVGTLASKEEKRLSMKVLCPARGELACQAWVTFTGSSILPVQVREPKLVIKSSGPDKAILGDTTSLVFAVANPGDCAAEKARISVTLPPGLESARGNKLSYDLGDLQPGETRTLQVPCATKAAGEQRCEAIVEAEGLKTGDTVTINVIQPRLDVEVHGPKLRYLERRAVYAIKVSNPGEAPAVNVFVTHLVPEGFKFVSADNGGSHEAGIRLVKWFIGDLAPGQSKEVKVELQTISAGEHTHKVVASGGRTMRTEKELVTRVEGQSEVLLEVTDLDDPIEVGGETAYEVKVSNTGSKTETKLQVICTLPSQLEFKSAQGPVQFRQAGGEVVFEAVPELAPHGELVFKVLVKAKAKGDARFRARLTSTNLPEPVEKVESTHVYEE